MDMKQILTRNRTQIENWARQLTQSQFTGEMILDFDKRQPSAICRVLGKYLMYVNPQDVSVAPHLMLNGIWEPWITMAIGRHIKPGMHCVDVGAHVGYYTMLMADLVGDRGRVVAVEPQAWATECLKRSLSMNGYKRRITVVNAAATAEGGQQRQLACHPFLTGEAFIRKSDPETMLGGPFRDGPMVGTVTVDYLMTDPLNDRVDFVKIDAEGSEQEVIQGMMGLIKSEQPLVICVEVKGDASWLEQLAGHGFTIRRINFHGDIEEPVMRAPLLDWEMFWLERK